MSGCARTEILIGKEGLLTLANAHITVAGLGGVGGICAESLVRAGIGEITIIDFDIIELSDTNRQIIATHSTIGLQKIDALTVRLKDINPHCKVNAKNIFIDEKVTKNIANSDTNFVADCIDSILYKALLIKNCLQANKKIISSMGAGGKLDATKIEIVKMEKTINCGLAREIRKKLRNERVKMKFPVVFSSEVGKKALPHKIVKTSNYSNEGGARATNGVISYMPNIFGLMMAGHIINELLNNE